MAPSLKMPLFQGGLAPKSTKKYILAEFVRAVPLSYSSKLLIRYYGKECK